MLKIGVIGFGYWGPNIVRNFNNTANARVVAVCDQNQRALERLAGDKSVKLTTNFRDVIDDPNVEAVAVITPVSTHFPIAKAALEAGKHVFVEKPFTASIEEASELINLAERRNLTIMVDHTFLFTGAVRKLVEIINNGAIGDILFYDSTRVNLGLFQHDVNVIWDLAPHDFSILDYISPQVPRSVAATGFDHFKRGLENTAFITVNFDSMIAHFNVNWLSPVKVRKTLIGGSKKMLVWDDLEADEKLRVYDKGVDVGTGTESDLRINYRSGDASIPRIEHHEALKVEAEYFVNCVRDRVRPFNDGEAGLRVVKLIVAANESLRQSGKEIKI